MSSVGVGSLCFLKFTLNAAIYYDTVSISSCLEVYVDPGFIFQQDLAPAHTARATKSHDHGVTALDWPDNSLYLNLIESCRKIRNSRHRHKGICSIYVQGFY